MIQFVPFFLFNYRRDQFLLHLVILVHIVGMWYVFMEGEYNSCIGSFLDNLIHNYSCINTVLTCVNVSRKLAKWKRYSRGTWSICIV